MTSLTNFNMQNKIWEETLIYNNTSRAGELKCVVKKQESRLLDVNEKNKKKEKERLRFVKEKNVLPASVQRKKKKKRL